MDRIFIQGAYMKKLIILAAGKGTRMKSELPKVMHKLGNKPMLEHVIENACGSEDTEVILVVGYGADIVKNHFGDKVKYAHQTEQLGTGHAVMMAMDFIEDEDEVVIACGDTPLIDQEAFAALAEAKSNNLGAVVMTAFVENPKDYGRIIKENGLFKKIVEERDASEDQRKIQEVNVGTYVIDGKLLKTSIQQITNSNDQKEYYLTDVFEIAARESGVATSMIDEESMLGINSKLQLAQAEEILQKRINQGHMRQGVILKDPRTTYIDKAAEIAEDVVIYPNCHIIGQTRIGKNTIIRENTTIENSVIGEDCTVKSSTIIESKVGNATTIGPNAYLRPKSEVGNNCKIGDFVELKNAKFGDGSKASHLAYIGDAIIGKNVNIGCGVVFVNYDGKNKFTSTVGDHAFIGSNANLVAPVEIGENAFVAAGSTITDSVPQKSLAIARQRQTNKENWIKNY